MGISRSDSASGKPRHSAIVKIYGVNHQRIALPVSDGMAVCGRVVIIFVGMHAPVGIYVSHGGRRVNNDRHFLWTFADIEWLSLCHDSWNAQLVAPPD